MDWFFPEDNTEAIITADKHIQSGHVHGIDITLPATCVLFEMGAAIRFLRDAYGAYTLLEKMPGFIHEGACVAIPDMPGLCFAQGGYGAPAAVDGLETLHALGVRRIIIVGMCGVFAEGISVGDVIVPERILSEEGSSHHYTGNATWAYPDTHLWQAAIDHFSQSSFATRGFPTVTTDAIYRQTFFKEARWREMGCAGVDMEASALLTVARFYGMPAVCALLASDKHPLSPAQPKWAWGNETLSLRKRDFWREIVAFAAQFATDAD